MKRRAVKRSTRLSSYRGSEGGAGGVTLKSEQGHTYVLK